MKISEYIKQNGILKICEKCNYDIRDIRLNLLRETDLSDLKTLLRIKQSIFGTITELKK